MSAYTSLLIAALLLFATSTAVAADGGYYIPVHPNISIYEPGQKAIIAWNGEQEVIILSVDLWVEENSWVLEFIPFPSQPTVEAGNFDSFYEIADILDNRMYSKWVDRFVPGMGYGGAEGENFEVLFQENIGAHHITVARATNAQELITFAQDLWVTNVGSGELSWGRLQDLAAAYIEQEIQYWVMDLLELKDYLKSREPLVYTFKSDYLYFPLEISSMGAGETSITLYTITPENTDNYPIVENAGLSKGSFWVGYGWRENHENFPMEFQVTQEELGRISPKVAELFDNGAWLTAWQYYGALAELEGDFKIAAVLPSSPTPAAQAQPAGGASYLTEALLFVLLLILQIEIFALAWRKRI